MFIGHCTEQPWQDEKTNLTGARNTTLDISNRLYDPGVGAELYNRYLDEKMYAEEMGFDGLMLNEHHSPPFCMQGVTNVEAAILARQTRQAKIIILGNILPIWDDPLWLAEQLAIIDMISRGRLVSGFVRGGGTESISHNTPPTYNWERFQEAHDFIIKVWTTPGPWRWEGRHYEYRHINPWAMPLQKPHPPIWIPGVVSPSTTTWAAQHRYLYIMLATKLDFTKEMFQLYHDTAAACDYQSGTHNVGYMVKVHVEETEAKAEEVGRKYLTGRPRLRSMRNTTAKPGRQRRRKRSNAIGRWPPVCCGNLTCAATPCGRCYVASPRQPCWCGGRRMPSSLSTPASSISRL